MPPKTDSLPGLEVPVIPAITEAAEAYAEKRDARMALLKEEVEKKNALMTLMHTHELTTYRDSDRDPPVTVELKTSEKIKVKIGDGEEESDDSE